MQAVRGWRPIRHCEEHLRRSNPHFAAALWIASLSLATTGRARNHLIAPLPSLQPICRKLPLGRRNALRVLRPTRYALGVLAAFDPGTSLVPFDFYQWSLLRSGLTDRAMSRHLTLFFVIALAGTILMITARAYWIG